MEPKTGLVLEGGAMRGLFSHGVLDVFLENGIRADAVAAVSAGATFGCNYLTNQPRRAIRYCINYRHDPRFCSVASLMLTGDMYGAEFCYHTLPEILDPIDNDTFLQCGVPFYVVTTNLRTGKAVYHQCHDLLDRRELEWVRASASMPLASKIVKVDGYELLDGGVADSIPLKFMEYKGYTRNIVILTQPAGYEKQPNSLLPLMRKVYAKYPRFLRTIARRHEQYNAQTAYVAQQEAAGNVFVIRPPKKLPVSHISHDADTLREVYAIGRAEGLARMDALKTFLTGQM